MSYDYYRENFVRHVGSRLLVRHACGSGPSGVMLISSPVVRPVLF